MDHHRPTRTNLRRCFALLCWYHFSMESLRLSRVGQCRWHVFGEHFRGRWQTNIQLCATRTPTTSRAIFARRGVKSATLAFLHAPYTIHLYQSSHTSGRARDVAHLFAYQPAKLRSLGFARQRTTGANARKRETKRLYTRIHCYRPD